MRANEFYNGQDFPAYIFTDKIKSYIFVEFEMVFAIVDFWNIAKSYLQGANIKKIIVDNLKPDFHFIEEISVSELPDAYLKLIGTENLDGYFPCSVNLHLMTIQTLMYSHESEVGFCIVADRDYELAIVGFSTFEKPEAFSEYEIKDLPKYLKFMFPGREVRSDFKKRISDNWKAIS